MVATDIKRNRGGQLGKQNARKHGFYSRSLTRAQKRELKNAVTLKGVDEEIALVRIKLKSILDNDPDNARLFNLAVSSLVRLLRFKYKYEGPNHEEKLRIAFGNVWRDYVLPVTDGKPEKLMAQFAEHWR